MGLERQAIVYMEYHANITQRLADVPDQVQKKKSINKVCIEISIEYNADCCNIEKAMHFTTVFIS